MLLLLAGGWVPGPYQVSVLRHVVIQGAADQCWDLPAGSNKRRDAVLLLVCQH
jgi:hypothetical protein